MVLCQKVSSGPFILKVKMKRKFKVDKHILIPKHSKLSEKEKEKLLEKYNVSLKELPMVLKTDSSIANMDARPRDIIKITRKSPTGGEAIFYRVVTNV